MARLTLSAGMFAPFADSMAALRRRLPLGSPPPFPPPPALVEWCPGALPPGQPSRPPLQRLAPPPLLLRRLRRERQAGARTEVGSEVHVCLVGGARMAAL